MKTYKLKEKDYFDKNDIEIEMTKEVETIVQAKTEVLTVRQIKEKIEKVKAEKALVVERYDKEIDELKNILVDLKVDKVEIKVFKLPKKMLDNEAPAVDSPADSQ